MTEFFIGLYVLVLIVCIANIIRLHYYGKFLIGEVDRIFDVRMAGDRTVTYPAITASYNNFKWYDLFNYKFDKLVVYE
jgi:hypothetical protein